MRIRNKTKNHCNQQTPMDCKFLQMQYYFKMYSHILSSIAGYLNATVQLFVRIFFNGLGCCISIEMFEFFFKRHRVCKLYEVITHIHKLSMQQTATLRKMDCNP